MAFYENTIIAKQDLAEKELKSVKEKYNDLINESSGKVIKIEEWGLLNLANKIKNYKKGFYIHYKFEGSKNTLDKIEEKLNSNNYLVGNQLTEADIRLVTTLLRFDNVYHYHFKCNLKKISDYKNLSRYLEQFKKLDCIKRTTFNDHIKRHYFFSHESINPTRIIPIGPIVI